jgi:hypothetical protein
LEDFFRLTDIGPLVNFLLVHSSQVFFGESKMKQGGAQKNKVKGK